MRPAASAPTRWEWAALTAILLLATGLRLYLLLGPFSEIDADEAVVGLMAMQVPGELPAFYWEQEYLGTVEPMVAAAVFAVLGPSGAALKLVPAIFSVAFIALVYLTARPMFGAGPALLSALYLAVPPSFFAAWSVKARGGYPEALVFGQACLLAAQRLADGSAGWSWRWAAVAGLAAGLALWTHPLSVVMVLAAGLYVLLARRPWQRAALTLDIPLTPMAYHGVGREGVSRAILAAGAALLVGLGPAIVHNVLRGFPSLRFASAGGTEPGAALLNLWGLVRYGLPVLVGLAEGTPSRELLLQDWPNRVGSSWLVTVALPLLGLGVVWWHRRALAALVRGSASPSERGPALILLVLLLVLPFVAVSRFANLWAEPRYALPIYAAVPLVAAIVWAAGERRRVVSCLLAAGLLGVNVFSLLTGNYSLSLPTTAGASTTANRAELIRALQARQIDRIYTDYWLAYPIAFESREQIVPAVWSGGFSRRASYSHLVFIAEAPAFVFAADTAGDREFRERLSSLGGRADQTDIGIYRVYTAVEPLDAMRRP